MFDARDTTLGRRYGIHLPAIMSLFLFGSLAKQAIAQQWHTLAPGDWHGEVTQTGIDSSVTHLCKWTMSKKYSLTITAVENDNRRAIGTLILSVDSRSEYDPDDTVSSPSDAYFRHEEECKTQNDFQRTITSDVAVPWSISPSSFDNVNITQNNCSGDCDNFVLDNYSREFLAFSSGDLSVRWGGSFGDPLVRMNHD